MNFFFSLNLLPRPNTEEANEKIKHVFEDLSQEQRIGIYYTIRLHDSSV